MKPDLRMVAGADFPQVRLLPWERVRFCGPRCVCDSRETSHVGPGRRHCKQCGLVEFRVTADGYRGVRVVTPLTTAAGASSQERPGQPRSPEIPSV